MSPHASAIALPVLLQEAYANLVALRTRYPGIYTSDGGFYDAVNPVTGAIGHRRLVLDQSMIMAALDDVVNGDALQRYFAADRSVACPPVPVTRGDVDPLTRMTGFRPGHRGRVPAR